MTTICTNGKVIAADRLSDYRYALYHCKLELENGWIYAGTGIRTDVKQLIDYFRFGTEIVHIEENPEIICTNGQTTWFMDKSLTKLKMEGCLQAIGSGAQFAMAAMVCGKNPVEAIEIACSLMGIRSDVNYYNFELGGEMIYTSKID